MRNKALFAWGILLLFLIMCHSTDFFHIRIMGREGQVERVRDHLYNDDHIKDECHEVESEEKTTEKESTTEDISDFKTT